MIQQKSSIICFWVPSGFLYWTCSNEKYTVYMSEQSISGHISKSTQSMDNFCFRYALLSQNIGFLLHSHLFLPAMTGFFGHSVGVRSGVKCVKVKSAHIHCFWWTQQVSFRKNLFLWVQLPQVACYIVIIGGAGFLNKKCTCWNSISIFF